jgi:hypothetical protein
MPKFAPQKPRDAVSFYCRSCKHTFEVRPDRVEPDDDPDQAHHPFRYAAACPKCGEEVGQAPWERALQKAWQNATGPKTPEGKAAAARNLEGHPTPAEAQRTRFNAMKHGLHAETAQYFPAKPDGYAFCKTCTIDRDYCRAQSACTQRTELFMLHHAAFEQGDPDRLQGLHANLQAAIFAVLQQILQTIIADGVKLTSPQYYTDKEGKLIIAEYYDYEDNKTKVINDIQAHPLFKPLGELLSRNNLSLADMGMTAKAIGDREEAMGRLASDTITRESLLDFQQRQARALESISGQIQRARELADRDPALLEYNADSGEATLVGK